MKKLCAIFLFVFLTLALAGCKSGKEENTVIPDFSYWQENIEKEEVKSYIGIRDVTSPSMGDEKETVLKLMEEIDYSDVQADFVPFLAQEDMRHFIRLLDYNQGKDIRLCFYDDFRYACFYENDERLPSFAVKNPEQYRQFFRDHNFYISYEERVKTVDFIADYFNTMSTQDINELVQASNMADTNKPVIKPDGDMQDINVTTVTPYDKGYSANVYITYRYDNTLDEMYIFNLYLIPVENKQNAYETSVFYASQLVTETASESPYTIANVDYSRSMQRLDAPYHNKFYYSLASGIGSTGTSSILWINSIMNCVNNLELGKVVDKKVADYPKQFIYSILLHEVNDSYEAPFITLTFVDDFNYVSVCDCDDLAQLICEKQHTVYQVKNPQIVRGLFEDSYLYITEKDYNVITDFVTEFIENNTIAQLNQFAIGEGKLPVNDNTKIAGIYGFEITKNVAPHLWQNNNGYNVTFFVFCENEVIQKYDTCQMRVVVVRDNDNWAVEDVYIG